MIRTGRQIKKIFKKKIKRCEEKLSKLCKEKLYSECVRFETVVKEMKNYENFMAKE